MGNPMTVTTSAPPGWYPDPWRLAFWRWWDGASWTVYTEQWFAPPPTAPTDGQLRAGGIAILGFLVGLGVSTVIGVVLLLAGYETTDPAFLLGSTLGLWFGLGGSCVVAVRRNGTGSLRDLGLVKPRWLDVAMGVGFAVAGVIAVTIIAALLTVIDKHLLPGGRTDLSDPVQNGGILGIVVVYFIAVVGAPFFEELYFRGLVQGTLVARWGVVIGIVVQALLFGLVHLDPNNGWGNVGTFAIITTVGLGLGTIRRFSGRLPPGMFTHAGYNAIIVTIALLAK
ncbi:MAG: CPBP family glutamic-type intramembrane protease [Acidimicrobiia bacterium]